MATAGLVFHVLNRGVRRLRLFEEAGDYRAFLLTFQEAQERVPVDCFAYCVMPNHFHLVVRPQSDGDLSRFMAWLTATHSKRWHAWRKSAGIGHVYQGRFKALPVSSDIHFLHVCRYVERNALRAGLVTRAEAWPWSSLAQRIQGNMGKPAALTAWPVECPPDWTELVQQDAAWETDQVRDAIRRSAPYGSNEWRQQLARRLELSPSVARIGRPRRQT